MATISEALSRHHVQLTPKVYIKNDSATYVDYSDRFANDRLDAIGDIVYTADSAHGQPVLQSVTIKVNNEDRYWDSTPPSGFDPWEGRYVQIRVDVADATEGTLGTFRIAPDGITTDLGDTASITLESLKTALSRVEADSVKRGQQWYQGRPWTFLISELIRTEYADASGDLPSTYEIPSDARVTFPDGNKHFTSWGHPPQWDGSSWNEDSTATPYCIEYDSTNDLVYVGLDADLWVFDPSTDTWTNLGEDATVGTGATLRAIFLCDAGVVCCKWDDDYSTAYGTSLYITFYDTTADGWDTTTRTTVSDFTSGMWLTYNGVYQTAMGANYQVRGYYTVGITDYEYGTHVAVPFRQYVTHNQTSAEYNDDDVSALTEHASGFAVLPWTDLGASSPPPYGSTLNAGYHPMRGASGTSANLELKVAYGSKPNLDWDRQDSTVDGYLYAAYYDTGNTNWNIYRIPITQGSSITPVAQMPTTGTTQNYPIISLSLTKTFDSVAYISWHENVDATGYDYTSVYWIYVGASPPYGFSPAFNNTNLADNTDIMTDILYHDLGTDDFLIVKYKAARIDTFPQWQVSYVDNTTNAETVLDSSSGPFIVQRQNHAAFPVFYVDSQSGAVKYLSSFTGAPQLVDGGRPPVFDAPFCMDFRYKSGSDPDIYGISAPHFHPVTQETAPEGKYYLWQYTTKHAGRIEVADFSDLDKMQAAHQIADAFRHIVDVEPDGDFVVKPRAPATAAATTVPPDTSWEWGWTDLSREKAAPIVNYVEAYPYEATLGKMETTLVQKPTSAFDGTIDATQTDTLGKRVRFRCMSGGKISGGSTRWDVLSYKQIIETRLAAAYTSGTTLTLDSVWDIAIGDQISVSDSAIKGVTAVSASASTVTMSSALATSYPIHAPVRISKINDQTWSSQGITTLNGAINNSVTTVIVDNGDDIAVGNFLVIGEEEMEVTDKDSDGVTLTVTRGDNATSHSDADTVAMIVKPSATDTWTKVGNQGISIRFNSTTGTEQPFQVGDYIEFVCPGLGLEEVKQSKIIAADQTSIDSYGKRQNRGSEKNRFLTVRLAEFWADDQVSRGATQKRRFLMATPLNVDYAIGDTLTLESSDLLPDETSNQLDCIVTSVRYAPFKSANQTTYGLEEQ